MRTRKETISASYSSHQRKYSFRQSSTLVFGILYCIALVYTMEIGVVYAEAKTNSTKAIDSIPPPPPPPLNRNTTVETLMGVCNNSTQYSNVQNLSTDDEDIRTIAGLVTTSFADVTKIPNNADSGMQELIMACNPIVEKAVQDIDILTACQVQVDDIKYYIVEFRTMLTCSTMGAPQAWSLSVLTLVEIKEKRPINILKISVIG